jgi:hypothetical protein
MGSHHWNSDVTSWGVVPRTLYIERRAEVIPMVMKGQCKSVVVFCEASKMVCEMAVLLTYIVWTQSLSQLWGKFSNNRDGELLSQAAIVIIVMICYDKGKTMTNQAFCNSNLNFALQYNKDRAYPYRSIKACTNHDRSVRRPIFVYIWWVPKSTSYID